MDRRLPLRKTSTGIRDVGLSQSLRQSFALRYSLVSMLHKGSGYVGRRGHHRVAEVVVLLWPTTRLHRSQFHKIESMLDVNQVSQSLSY
jgi:hypothetical protein